jgi:streptogramin lyase
MQSLALAIILSTLAASTGTIQTAAGTGSPGDQGDGGPAVHAKLNMPFDLALDSHGNLYFSDTMNHRIRRIERTSGIITTVAGNGSRGFSGDGGAATRAQLNEPYGVVLDHSGNLFVADRLNRRIRRINTRTGVISTIAGNGAAEFSGDGGPATKAGLVEPNGVALASNDRLLLIADVAGHRIRQVDLRSERISTFAGTGKARHAGDGGPAISAAIWGARAVDVGPGGSVYILEREGNCLRSVDPASGIISTIAGTGAKGYTGDGGAARSAAFNGPKELAVDSGGNIFIVDTENHAIRCIDAKTKRIRTLAGTGRAGGGGDGGEPGQAELDRPHGVAVSPDRTCWIADTNNHRVRVIRPDQ